MKEDFRVFMDADNDDMDVDEEGGVEDAQRRLEMKKHKKEELTFEILSDSIEGVKEACIKRNYPLIEEYDFKRDTDLRRSPDLNIELKSST